MESFNETYVVSGRHRPALRQLTPCAPLAQDDRARAEALLFFNGKRDFLDEDEAVYASEDVDPLIQELVASVQEQLPLLQKQTARLSDGIEVDAVHASVARHPNNLGCPMIQDFLLCCHKVTT